MNIYYLHTKVSSKHNIFTLMKINKIELLKKRMVCNSILECFPDDILESSFLVDCIIDRQVNPYRTGIPLYWGKRPMPHKIFIKKLKLIWENEGEFELYTNAPETFKTKNMRVDDLREILTERR